VVIPDAAYVITCGGYVDFSVLKLISTPRLVPLLFVAHALKWHVAPGLIPEIETLNVPEDGLDAFEVVNP